MTINAVRDDVASATVIPPASYAYRPAFPRADLLAAARELLPPMVKWDGHEGPRARITISPGAIGVNRRNYARHERTYERALGHAAAISEQLAAELLATGQFPPRPAPRQEITAWSRKSRCNMVRSFCEIDYYTLLRPGRPPAMVTLTYPGDWLTVAPNGRAAKRHLAMFRRRYRRAWGEGLHAIWKLEFQGRGAPHYHLLMVPPHGRAQGAGVGAGMTFKHWLSAVWASVVGHPDPIEYIKHLNAGTRIDFAEGLRAADPKRVAVYFTKHGGMRAKEYQHIVPVEWRGPGDGPGRFWGYWHLRRLVYAVELYEHDRVAAVRTLRRWARAQGTTQQVDVVHYRGGDPVPAAHDVIGLAGKQYLGYTGDRLRVDDGQIGVISIRDMRRGRKRGARRRVKRMRGGAGWVSVNDGAKYAEQLGRYFALLYKWALNSRDRPLP